MAIKDIFSINRKTFFNPRAWLGYDTLKAQTIFLYNAIKPLFTPEQATRTETFEEALVRMNLTEADLDEKEQDYLVFSLIFLILSALAFSYSFILLFYYKSLAGWILALCACAMLLVQAFRYDFWRFQIKFRKLGCTFQEWKQGKPNDREESVK